MSKETRMPDESYRKNVRCPHCGQRFDTVLVRSFQPDSAALRALLDSSLNCPNCPNCKQSFRVETGQLIYKDPEAGFFLMQSEEDSDLESIAELEQELDSLASEIAWQENLPRPIVRLVFNREDLIEKIFLQQRGIDDRLIEYAKFQLFQNTGGQRLLPQQHRLLFDFSNSDRDKMQFFVFGRESGKPEASLHLPMQDFRKMQEFASSAELQKELDRLFPGCQVNVENLYDEK
jgi:hypothetical protein